LKDIVSRPTLLACLREPKLSVSDWQIERFIHDSNIAGVNKKMLKTLKLSENPALTDAEQRV